MGSTPVTRFLAYVMVALAVMGAAWILHSPDTAFAQWRAQIADLVVFGRRVSIDSYVLTVITMLVPLFGALAAEYLMSGGRHSTLRQLRGAMTRTRRLDMVLWVLNFPPLLMAVLGTLLTFGLAPILNKAVRASIPANLHLFDRLSDSVGLVATICVFILLKSFIEYWTHRAFHTPFFWPLHRLHHSASEMSLLTSFRVHPTSSAVAPLVNTLPMLLWGAPTEFLICFMAYNTFHEIVVHTNHDCDWGWIGKNLLFAPISHKIHHSVAEQHRDKNFSTNLAIWDRLFGTFRYDPQVAQVGINDSTQIYEHASLPRVLLRDMSDFGSNVTTALQRRRTRDPAYERGPTA